MDFSEWLENELEKRGWSRSEAARRGGISPSMFDKVINGYSKPGKRFLEGVAQALKISIEDVYRVAGILPQFKEGSSLTAHIGNMIERLPIEDQEDVRKYIEYRLSLAEERGRYEAKPKAKPAKP
jgi:transcriptional regulator with XRE-family HTH domain